MTVSLSGSGFAYHAFISYSHTDKVWAGWLHKALENWRVPSRLVGKETAAGTIPRRLSPIFRDRDELASSHDLGNKVNEALAKSEALIVICSPHSAQSRWVNEEVLAFKRLGRTERIFCVIVDGEPDATDKPGREAEECFCPALRYTLDEQGQPTSERTEPIAADARAGKDGKSNAKLKLIAGLLDVGFDELKHREQHRKMQRLVAVTSLALMVMAVTVVLAVFALISRRDAVTAQHKAVAAQHTAVVAQQAAERRQKQAEGLVNFMLGNLTNKLWQVGRTDIMRSVNDKAMAYFKSLPIADVNDSVLAQRAKTLEKIGGIRLQSGDGLSALESFRASARISSRLAAAEPNNVARQIAYSRTQAFIGRTLLYKDKLDGAERNLELGRQALQSALKHAPNNPSLLIQSVYLDSNIGGVLNARGRPKAAEMSFHAMLLLAKKLVAAEPNNRAYVQALSAAHTDLGSVALQRGDMAKTVAEHQADDDIQTAASARNPRDHDLRSSKSASREELGAMLILIGDGQTGMRDLQEAKDISAQLMKLDPRDAAEQDVFSNSSVALARVKRLSGNQRTSHTLNAKEVTILATLYQKDVSDSSGAGDYAKALIEQAAEQRASGHRNSARGSAQRALHILVPFLTKHPDDRDTLLATMTAKLLLASVTDDSQSARALRKQALDTMQSVKIGLGDPRLLALQVGALLALDRKTDAQPLIKQVWSSGYRDPGFVDVLRRAHIDYPPNPAFQAKLAAEANMHADAVPPAGDLGNK